MIIFGKISKAMKIKKRTNFELECLPPIQYSLTSNQNLKSPVKTLTLGTGIPGLFTKRNHLKFLTLHSPFCSFIRKITDYSLGMFIYRGVSRTGSLVFFDPDSKWSPRLTHVSGRTILATNLVHCARTFVGGGLILGSY